MTFSEAVTQARKIKPGNYFSVSAEYTEHHDGEVELEWQIYINGYTLAKAATPEAALEAMRKRVNGPQKSEAPAIEAVGGL